MYPLSKGSLKKIIDGGTVTDPIMQIMLIKNIQNNMDGMTRYKVTLYDGEMQHTFGILATQKNVMVENNELRVGSVIKLDEYAANVLAKDPPKVVIILLNFEILGEMSTETTSPVSNRTASVASNAPTAAPPQQHHQSKPIHNENNEPNKPNNQISAKTFFNNKEAAAFQPKPTPLGASNQSQMFNNLKIFGISSLNPYQNKWAIRARVTNKSAIKNYNNAKGPGKLFNIDLIDNTGEIRASGFNEHVDKFYELLQIDHVYYISRGSLKTANKQYSKLENDYEMTFTNDTVIEECQEEDNIPHMNLNIVKLSDLPQKNPNDYVDIVGVVKSTSDVSTIVAKATQRELKKREICLVDDSNCSVNCTLWGSQAEEFDGNENPVVLLRGAKVGDFGGGRTLSVTQNTVFQINPDIPQSHTLKGWFDQAGNNSDCTDLSHQGAGAMGGTSMGATSYKTLDQTKDEHLGMGDKADYFVTKAIILYAKKDNSMYMACPGDGCNKKVVDQNDGTYRCEKCARNYSNFKWRMILSVNVADYTDSNWATCFQDTAETILGVDAEKLGEMKNTNDPKYDEVFSNCVFKEFNFKMRAKMETYNDERRVKISAVNVDRIDFVQSGKSLLQKIKMFVQKNPQ